MTRRILTYLPIVASGGAERLTIDVLNGLSSIPNNGLEHHLVTDRLRSTFLDQASSSIRLHHLDDAASPWHRATRLGAIAKAIAAEIIVAHMSHTALTVALMRLLYTAARNSRFIVVEHSLPRQQFDDSAGLRAQLIRRLLPPVYRRADRVVCVSACARADVAALLGPTDNLCLIRNGVDLARIRNLSEEEVPGLTALRREKRRWTVVVGRMVPVKNHLLLLSALRSLVRDEPDIGLLIVGDGPMRETLTRHVSDMKLGDYVRFTGYLHNPYPFMREAEVVISSSLYEGLGLALIEGLALGRQVVAVANPGTAEVLADGRAGFLCSNDAGAAAAAIRSALTTPFPTSVLTERASEFDISDCVSAYHRLLTS